MRHLPFVCLLVMLAGCDEMPDDGTPTDSPAATNTAVPQACSTTNEQCGPNTCAAGQGSPTMLPGANCMSCHSPGNLDDLTASTGGAQARQSQAAGFWSPTARTPLENLFFTVAGTAFTDLEGTGPLSGATITVIDSTGKTVTLTTNAVGNFYTAVAVTPPLTAEISYNGNSRKMAHQVDTGACNSCHVCEGSPGGKLHGP